MNELFITLETLDEKSSSRTVRFKENLDIHLSCLGVICLHDLLLLVDHHKIGMNNFGNVSYLCGLFLELLDSSIG